MMLDSFLPAFDFHEIHKVEVRAPAEAVAAAARGLRPSELSPLVFWMLHLRELPAIVAGKHPPALQVEGTFLEQLYDGGFLALGENDHEVVFGLVGQFWKLTGGMQPEVQNPQAFLDFHQTDFAKVAANLLVRPQGSAALLSTETRIWAPDESTRRKFAGYWRVISAGSGWIRLLWLHAIKRRAEKVAGASTRPSPVRPAK